MCCVGSIRFGQGQFLWTSHMERCTVRCTQKRIVQKRCSKLQMLLCYRRQTRERKETRESECNNRLDLYNTCWQHISVAEQGKIRHQGFFLVCVCVCLCVGVRATGRNCPSTCTTMDYGLQNIRGSICYRCKTLCFNVNCVCEATAFKISLDRPGQSSGFDL